MSKLRRAHAPWAGALIVLTAGLLGSCGRPAGKLELTSYKDPYFPETYEVTLNECAYRVDASGDTHIVGRCVTQNAPSDGPITQMLHMHVFWQPRPGVTFANATTATAVLRYVVATPGGTAVYGGTGFVYPRRQRGGRLEASIESGRLRLEMQSGQVPELLGDARLRGEIKARHDPHATLSLVRELDYHAAGRRGDSPAVDGRGP